MKISITPVVAILEVLFLGKRLPLRLYLPIVFIICGVGMSTIKDFSVVCLFNHMSNHKPSVEYQRFRRWSEQCICNSNLPNPIQDEARTITLYFIATSSI